MYEKVIYAYNHLKYPTKQQKFDDVIMKLKDKQDDNSKLWEETIHYTI